MPKITASDGHQLNCWTIEAASTRKGGIVILQEIFGVTDQLKGLAQQYAKSGYEVSIPALFDRQAPDTVIPFNEGPKGRELMLGSRMEDVLRDIEAAVTAQAEKGPVVVMGFCWGGGLALRCAQKLNIVGAISFYGTNLPAYMDSPFKVPVLGHFGDSDGHVPMDMLDQAKAYWPDMQAHVYEAGHAFANDARAEYVEAAAQLAHQRNATFLESVIA